MKLNVPFIKNASLLKTASQIMTVMHRNINKISLIFLLGLTVTIGSCGKSEKQNIIPTTTTPNPPAANVAARLTGAPALSTNPALNVYTNVPSTCYYVSSSCGTFSSAVIRSRVTATSSSGLTVEISKVGGGSFGFNGTGYVKGAQLCGPIVSQTTGVSVSSSSSTVSLTVNVTFDYGFMVLYPEIITSSGARYYSEPIIVYTIPMYNPATSYSVGQVIGTANTVDVKANNNNNLSLINSYQCVEYCSRYYQSVYGKTLTGMGAYAALWYNNGPSKGLTKFPNGSVPKVGDIICFGGGSNACSTSIGCGHVAIIIEVGTNFVKIAQQNSGMGTPYSYNAWNAIGGYLSMTSSYVISPPSSSTAAIPYYVQGLLRL